MEGHDEKADELEREVEELKEHAEEVGDHVDEAKATWEARKADAGVPGAVDDDALDVTPGADGGEKDDEDGEG